MQQSREFLTPQNQVPAVAVTPLSRQTRKVSFGELPVDLYEETEEKKQAPSPRDANMFKSMQFQQMIKEAQKV